MCRLPGRLHSGEDSCFHGEEGESLSYSDFEVRGGKTGLRRRRAGARGRARGAGAVRAAGRGGARGSARRSAPAWCARALLEVLEPAPRARRRRRAPTSAAAAAATTSTRPTTSSWTAKGDILREELRRVGKIEPPPEQSAIVAGEPWRLPQPRAVPRRGRANSATARPARTGSAPSSTAPSRRPRSTEVIATLRGHAARPPLAALRPLARSVHQRDAKCSSTCSNPDSPWRAASSTGARRGFPGWAPGALDYRWARTSSASAAIPSSR